MQKSQDKKLDLIEKIVQKSPEKSDLELFFSSIFKTVRKFSLKDQALLKIKIHQIVSEKEISYLDRTLNSADHMQSISDPNNSKTTDSNIDDLIKLFEWL